MSEENIPTIVSPLISEAYPQIAKNQNVNQAAVNNLKKGLRSEAMKVNCPYCNNFDFTKVETSRNNCNMAFCILSLYVPWCITKIFRRKDKNFSNAVHRCCKCDTQLANYDAC
jgi:hypothetical protein